MGRGTYSPAVLLWPMLIPTPPPAGNEPVASYPGDLTNLHGAEATPAEGVKSKRKQTLLSLLEALQELSRETDVGAWPSVAWPNFHLFACLGIDQKPSFEDDRDVREYTMPLCWPP